MNNTLANGLRLLGFLSGTAEAYSVTELAQRLALPKSHVHRLLQSLCDLGYARQDEDRRYRIGLEPLVVSAALLGNHPLRREALPHLYRLAAETGMDALIAIPHQGAGLVLAASYPQGRQRDPGAAIGSRLGYPGTATGKLFACSVAGFGDPGAVEAEERLSIARVAFAFKDPRCEAPINGMAAAIHDADGSVIAALGLSAPREHFVAALERARALQLEAAAAIGASLAVGPLSV